MANNLQLEIIKKIENGEILPGQKLLSERKLAEMLGIGRMTVQYAYDALEKQGYLIRKKGSGTFVIRNGFDRMDLQYLSETGNGGITAMLKNYNIEISNKVLASGFAESRFFAYKLGIDEKESVFFLHRVRYGDRKPLAVEYTYIPAKEFPEVDSLDFSEVSLYDYMDSAGKMPKYFNQTFTVTELPQKEAEHMGVAQGKPAYFLEFTCFDKRKKIVEYTESYVDCDNFKLQFNNRQKK